MLNTKPLLPCLLFAIAIGACAPVCFGGSITDVWLGGSGSWSNSPDWSAGVPNNNPPTTYAATIGSGGTDQVTLDISPTIDSLTLGGVTGSALLQSGAGSQTLQIVGGLTVNPTGTIALNNGDSMIVAGSAANAGSIGLNGGASLGLASLTNSGSVTVVGSTTNLMVTGDVMNTNALTLGYQQAGFDSGNMTVGGTLYNSSSLFLGNGTVANVNALNNTASVGVNGTLNLTGGGPGVTDIAAGVSYAIGGTFDVINGGVATNALANLTTVEGSLQISNGQTTIASLTNSGGVSVIGSTTNLVVTGDVTNTNALTLGYQQAGFDSGNMTVGGTLYNSSSLFLGYGTVANVNALNNTASVTINGALSLTGGGPGVTDIAAGVSYVIGGTFSVINGGVATNALANLTTVEGGLQISNGQTTTIASLTNSGGISVIGSTTNLAVTGDVTNTNALTLGYQQAGFDSGNMTVGGNLYNSSSVFLGSGTTLIVDGTFDNLTGESDLAINGTACFGGLVNFGTVTIGSAGSLDGAGCVAPTAGTFTETVSGDDSFGFFDFSGEADLGGTLDVLLEDDFTPTVGESFDFVNFAPGDLSGAFTGIENDFFNNGTEQWVLTYDNADGEVLLTAEAAQSPSTPEPSTMLLIGSGLIGVGCWTRIRRRR